MDVVRYNIGLRDEWDAFVKSAKNSTFLFLRDYMDYHADRFVDASLMFYEGGCLRALLPANISDGVVASHGGLTYGGFILSEDVRGAEVLAIFEAAMQWMKRELSASRWFYKPLPHIYSRVPAQEDLYALFRVGARLVGRSLSSTVNNDERVAFTELRRRKIAKASKMGLSYCRCWDFPAFWTILSDVLASAHGCRPVHTLDEIQLLESRFPENIKLYGAFDGDRMIAGCVVYETPYVAHIQYIAASPEGKAAGALDGLFDYLFREYKGVSYIDFGISTENGGSVLNEGLLFQKEGFGARGVVYDVYEIDL
jgi:hypothetical protein